MAEKLYDVMARSGSYQKDGQTKNRYENIGAIFYGEHGPYLLLRRSVNPAGFPVDDPTKESVLVSLFKPQEDGPKHFADDIPAAPGKRTVSNDSIPF